jgi:beta-N-acetylhexosaminidase
MTLQQKIGQLFTVGISGLTLTQEEKNFLVHNNIGGVILFARNIKSPEQVSELCHEIQSLRHRSANKAPFYISIDMEGGRVARLKAPFTEWSPLQKLGDLDSPSVAFNMAQAMGSELRAVGINLDFAPCIDVLTNPKNKVIGDRAISTDPEQVAKISSALVRGYIKSGIISCVKHFPGHGNTLVDSHDDLPIENADIERLEKVEFIPFKKAFKSRVDMVMTAHIRFPKIDPEWPVTLSSIFLKDILRDQFRYRGLIITDDLDMKALAKHYDRAEIPVRALEAGADLLLYCNEPESPPMAIEAIQKAVASGQITVDLISRLVKRVEDHKYQTLAHPDPIPWAEAKSIVGHPDHKKIAETISNGVIPAGLAAG